MMDYNTSEHKMLHETQNDLVEAIRRYSINTRFTTHTQFLQINSLTDAEIEDLYMQWGEKNGFIALMMPERTRIKCFVDWATTSPIQQYKLSNNGVK